MAKRVIIQRRIPSVFHSERESGFVDSAAPVPYARTHQGGRERREVDNRWSTPRRRLRSRPPRAEGAEEESHLPRARLRADFVVDRQTALATRPAPKWDIIRSRCRLRSPH